MDKGFAARLEKYAETALARIPYAEAVHILEDSGREFTYPASFGIESPDRARAFPRRKNIFSGQ